MFPPRYNHQAMQTQDGPRRQPSGQPEQAAGFRTSTYAYVSAAETANRKLARSRASRAGTPKGSGPVAGRRMESRSAPPPAHWIVGAADASETQRFPLHVRFSAPAGKRPEKEQADRAISTG